MAYFDYLLSATMLAASLGATLFGLGAAWYWTRGFNIATVLSAFMAFILLSLSVTIFNQREIRKLTRESE